MATTAVAARAQSAKSLLSRFWLRESSRVTPVNGVAQVSNPFLPELNPASGRWAPPRYSRRRQAELVKQARLVDVLDLLPSGPKTQRPPGGKPAPTVAVDALQTEAAQHPIQWIGEPKPVNDKGLYATRRFMFKGHKWERELPEREQAVHNFLLQQAEKKWVVAILITLYLFSSLFLSILQANTIDEGTEKTQKDTTREGAEWSSFVDVQSRTFILISYSLP